MISKLFSAPTEFLDDFHGNKSSKRFWGNRLLTIGVLLALVLFFTNLITPFFFGKGLITTHNNAMDIIQLFIYIGGGLLFGGLAERWFGSNKK
jgi:hypothetical protein